MRFIQYILEVLDFCMLTAQLIAVGLQLQGKADRFDTVYKAANGLCSDVLRGPIESPPS